MSSSPFSSLSWAFGVLLFCFPPGTNHITRRFQHLKRFTPTFSSFDRTSAVNMRCLLKPDPFSFRSGHFSLLKKKFASRPAWGYKFWKPQNVFLTPLAFKVHFCYCFIQRPLFSTPQAFNAHFFGPICLLHRRFFVACLG